MARIKEILLAVFVIIAVASATGFFMLKNDAEQAHARLNDTLLAQKVAHKRTQEKLARAEKECGGIKKSIEGVMEKAKALEQDLIAQKQQADSAKQKLAEADQKLSSLTENVRLAKANVDDLKSKIKRFADETISLAGELKLLTGSTQAMSAKLAEYTGTPFVPVSGSAVAAQAAGLMKDVAVAQKKAGVMGEVLTINREFNFIVVSLGKTDGIKEGMRLEVNRENEKLGEAEVETVRDNISAASLANDASIVKMRAGDKVFVYES